MSSDIINLATRDLKSVIIKRYDSFKLGYCNCNCGQEVNIRRVDGYLRRFINNHHMRGENNNHWQGGIIYHNGYIMDLRPNHPKCDSKGYVRRHRLVYEEHYNCCLLSFVHIHHVDENKHNNDISNLRPIYNSQHVRHHSLGKKYDRVDFSGRICKICNSDETYIKTNGKPQWLGNVKEGFLCKKCHTKQRFKETYIPNPKPKTNFEIRICKVCNSNETAFRDNGKPQWHGNEKNGFVCKSCYDKERYARLRRRALK